MVSPSAGRWQPRIVLATCRKWPSLSASDQRYAAALRAAGAQVAATAWNAGDGQPEFRNADLVVLRGTWDYHDDLDNYRGWLLQLDKENITTLNDVTIVSRFLDKREFLELAGDGVTAPRCHACEADSDAIRRILADEGWGRAVLKPVHGASGRGVQLVTPHTVDQALAAVLADVGKRDLLVQEFVPEIAEGETQYVLFDGKISHAVVKRPSAGEFRTNSAFAPQVSCLLRYRPQRKGSKQWSSAWRSGRSTRAWMS